MFVTVIETVSFLSGSAALRLLINGSVDQIISCCRKSGQSEPAAAVPALAQALLLPAVIQWQNLQKSFPCSPVLPSVCFPAERTLAAMAGRTEIRSASLRLSRKPAFWRGVLQSVCAGAVAGIVCSSASTSFHHVSAKSRAIRLFKVQRSYHPYCTGLAPFLQGKQQHSQRRLQKILRE